MLRAVLDTNVFVSALLSRRGPAAQIFNAWRQRKFLLIISPFLLQEIERVLRYPKIQQKYGISDQEIQILLELLRRDAIVVSGNLVVQNVIPDDPEDEHVLACALEGRADCIVSGDAHLLRLKTFQGIPILPLKAFLEKL